jgi:hypothetical protein
MIQDERWRACHLQRRLRPGLNIPDRKSVQDSRAALQCQHRLNAGPSGFSRNRHCSPSLDGYSTWLTSSADPAFATSAG